MAELADVDEAYAALSLGIAQADDDTLLEVGHAAIAVVVARTKHGVDVNGVAFKPYVPAYARQRVQASLSTQPDLVRTGHMLGGMIPVVSGEDEVTIAFPSEAEAKKAAANNGGTRRQNPRKAREFLDIRQSKELDFIAEVASESIVARVRARLK